MSQPGSAPRTPERRARRAALIGALTAIALVGGVIGWLAYQGSASEARLDELSTRFEALESQARARAVDLPEGLGEPVAINLFPHAEALQGTIDAIEEPLDGLPNTLPMDLQLAGLDEARRGRLLQVVQRALAAERAWFTEQTTLSDQLAVKVRQWLGALVEETTTFDSCAEHTVAVLRYAYALDAVSEVMEAEETTLAQLEPAIARCAAGAPREARHRAADAILRLADERVPPMEALIGIFDMARIMLEGAQGALQSPFDAGRATDLMDRAEEQLDQAEALVAHGGALDSFGDGVDGRLVQREQQTRLSLRLVAAVFRAGSAPGDAAAIEGMSDPVAGPILIDDGAVKAPAGKELGMASSITLASGPNSGGTLMIERPNEQGAGAEHSGTRGSLERAVIRRVIRASMDDVRLCYERALVDDPTLEGRVTVRFIIAPDGAVQNALVQDSELEAPRVEGCVATAVHQMRFPAPEGGGIVIVNYPFRFTSEVAAEN